MKYDSEKCNSSGKFGRRKFQEVLSQLCGTFSSNQNGEQKEFRSCRWGSSIPGLRTRDPPLSPPSTLAEIFRRMCLQSHLQTSPPVPQKSYLKFQNPTTTFWNTPLCPANMPYLGGVGGAPDFFLLHWNPNILVTEDPIQNFRTLRQGLLGYFWNYPHFPP